jgi:hypothetical protein
LTVAPAERRDPSVLDWLGILRDGWRILVILAVAGGIGGLLGTGLQSARYRATGSVLVTPSAFLDPSSASDLPTLTATVEQLAGTAAVMNPAAARFLALAPPGDAASRRAIATPDWVQRHIQVAQKGNSSILEISGLAPTQALANDLTRSVVRSLADVINEQSAQNLLPSSKIVEPSGVRLRIFTLAEADGQVSPTPSRNLVLGANAGLILGVIMALALGAANPRLRRPAEIAGAVGLDPGTAVAVTRVESDDEGVLEVATSLLLRLREKGGVVVLVTGTVAQDVLTAVASALVEALGVGGTAALASLHGSDRAGRDRVLAEVPAVSTAAGEGSGRAEIRSLQQSARPALFDVFPPSGGDVAHGRRAVMSGGNSPDFVVVAGPPLEQRVQLLPALRSVDHVILVTERGVRRADLQSARMVAPRLAAAMVLT